MCELQDNETEKVFFLFLAKRFYTLLALVNFTQLLY
jgi:hypothetical protein